MSGSRVSLVTIIALALLGGSVMAVAAARQSPSPSAQSHVASGFVAPFEYAIPASWQPNLSFDLGTVMALAEGDDGTPFVHMQVQGFRGVLVADVTDGYVHPCPGVNGGRSRLEVGDGPGEFLTDTQAIGGLHFEDLTETTLDGRRAIAAMSLARGRCSVADIHLEGLPSFEDHFQLAVPSYLVVTEVEGRTVLVQAWAQSERDLEEFLPMAQELIDTIDFVDPAS